MAQSSRQLRQSVQRLGESTEGAQLADSLQTAWAWARLSSSMFMASVVIGIFIQLFQLKIVAVRALQIVILCLVLASVASALKGCIAQHRAAELEKAAEDAVIQSIAGRSPSPGPMLSAAGEVSQFRAASPSAILVESTGMWSSQSSEGVGASLHGSHSAASSIGLRASRGLHVDLRSPGVDGTESVNSPTSATALRSSQRRFWRPLSPVSVTGQELWESRTADSRVRRWSSRPARVVPMPARLSRGVQQPVPDDSKRQSTDHPQTLALDGAAATPSTSHTHGSNTPRTAPTCSVCMEHLLPVRTAQADAQLPSGVTPESLTSLPCSHTFHERCIRGWHTACREGGKTPQCPECRHPFFLSEIGLHSQT